jgi:hypothetical protein
MWSLTPFLLLAGTISGFTIVIYLAMTSRCFLKGEIKRFTDFMMCGCMCLYGSVLSQYLTVLFALQGTALELTGTIFIYIGTIFFLLATNEIYELSKFIGFASEKMPKKLKEILG